MASSDLVWELVKKNNAFIKKGLNGTILSAEPGNLYAKHSFKYSGLANAKALSVATADGKVTLTKKTKKGGFKTVSFKSGKQFNRVVAAVAAEAEGYRSDLVKGAKAAVSNAAKSVRAAKVEA